MARSDEIRAVLLHWGLNMWGESLPDGVKTVTGGRRCNDCVKFSDALWNECVDRMVARKMNIVLIDLGEFPIWPSHSELALPGSRSPDWICAEVKRLKGLGLEPIPKLNFSATHDAWLGEYSRMLTTRKYYEVCHDLIRDAAEMFGNPRFIHLGMDEEAERYQYGIKIVRTDELWWHDLSFFCNVAEGLGMRPWIWSGHGLRDDKFVEKCPKGILPNTGYYDGGMHGFDMAKMPKTSQSWKELDLMIRLDKAGFEQVPCGTNWLSETRKSKKTANDECMAGLVKFCREHLSPNLLKGFMMASWEDCVNPGYRRTQNLNGIDQLAKALGQ